MRRTTELLCLFSILLAVSCWGQKRYSIENGSLARELTIKGGKLYTAEIRNKVNGKKLVPEGGQEFRLRISEGTHTQGTDVTLTSSDFNFVKILRKEPMALTFLLENKAHRLQVEVNYELKKDAFYGHKYLKIISERPVTLERIDVEAMALNDIYQPYSLKKITARAAAQWKPGLGQPLYGSESATFWGVEFPASYNYVENGKGYCGYQWGRRINSQETYTTYKAVLGVGDDPEFIQDDFFDYIDRIRIRPFRLQVQYNSWFDFGPEVDRESFGHSVSTVHRKLVAKRGVPPLNAYVIDDGWQDVTADWSDTTWKVNPKFDTDFRSSKEGVGDADSKLGLWLSPGCLLGAEAIVPKYKEQGFEAMGKWMSLAGPKYMQLLENRMLQLTENEIAYFKLDGLFGHLNTREFELHGNRYGIPYMPQLGTQTLSPSDSLLNDPKFDELKTYYLVAGTERLMALFQKQHQVNPEVYVVISNGAYLSPWWLMYIDTIWMINAGDASRGSNRTQEMVYRDGVYYDIWQKEHTQFPISSIFNHEPKKVKTGESAKTFREYLWMNLSRGTGFIELYLKTHELSESDWDVLAEGLKWAHKAFPYFKRARMHGGDPNASEVYGYSGWNGEGGYLSFHNPSDKAQDYTVILDRKLGVVAKKRPYTVSSPFGNAKDLEDKEFAFGKELKVTLAPKEVKILEFIH